MDVATAWCSAPTQPAGVGPLGAEEADISVLPAKMLWAGTRWQWGLAGMPQSWGTRQVTFCAKAEEGAAWPPRTFPARRLLPAACACARAPLREHQAKGCTRTKSWGLGI